MKNGYLYAIVKILIDKINRNFSLVEHFKTFVLFFNKEKKNEIKVDLYRNFAIDSFIVLKWLFLLLMIYFKVSNSIVSIIIWYLIITNVFTYFYYHLWGDNALNQEGIKKDRVRRRFMNLILAIAYSEISFTYLFLYPYVSDFNWGEKGASFFKSLQYSFSNSLAANYNVVTPNSGIGNGISNLQLLFTFFFITIILSRSIPQTNSND